MCLLVGGTSRFFPAQPGLVRLDLPERRLFRELEGDDLLPEMFIGRFTHQTLYRLGS